MMTHSDVVCEDWNPYFKIGCDGYCRKTHICEPLFVKYCNRINCENPPSSEANYAFNIAKSEFEQHKYESAIKIMQKLIEDYPLNHIYHANIARFYDRISSQNAEYHFRKAISINPNSHRLHTNYAHYAYTKLNNHKTAQTHFEKALQITQTDSVSHGMYAKFLRDVHSDYKNAEYHFERSLNLNPNDQRAMYQYAILLHKMGKLSEAKRYFEECIHIETIKGKKPFIWYHFEYALVLRDMNDLKNACYEFEFCLAQNNHPRILYTFGALLCQMEQIEKGLSLLHRALLAIPNNMEFKEAFEKYKNVKNERLKMTNCGDLMITKFNNLEITPSTKEYKTRRLPPKTKKLGTEQKEKSNVSPSEFEFERWMKNKIAINGQMLNVYLQMFVKRQFNDIRMMEYLDMEILESLITNRMHLKIFQVQIERFQSDMADFSNWLKQIGVYNEYRTVFEKNGILTFDSFYFYVNGPDDIEKIVGTKNVSDAQYIWSKTQKSSRRQRHIYKSEGC